MKNVSILSFIFLIGLASCRKDAVVELPYMEPKLVVSCFISPQDSIIQVAVSLTRPLYNNPGISKKFNPLTDANVTISNKLGSYQLNYNSKLERYTIDSSKLKINEGHIYELSVTSSDGKSVNAHTFIPFKNTSLQCSVSKDNSKQNEYTLNSSWKDLPIETDYYKLEVKYTSYYLYTSNGTKGSFIDTIKNWAGNTHYVKDLHKTGATINIEDSFKYKKEKKDTVFAILSSITKEYNDYYETLTKAISTGDVFNEPIQMYSNIKGGVGIFAGFNQHKLRIFPQ